MLDNPYWKASHKGQPSLAPAQFLALRPKAGDSFHIAGEQLNVAPFGHTVESVAAELLHLKRQRRLAAVCKQWPALNGLSLFAAGCFFLMLRQKQSAAALVQISATRQKVGFCAM